MQRIPPSEGGDGAGRELCELDYPLSYRHPRRAERAFNASVPSQIFCDCLSSGQLNTAGMCADFLRRRLQLFFNSHLNLIFCHFISLTFCF